MTQTILVTGSSRGIGKAIALKIAQMKFDVVLHCRADLDAADSVKSTIESMGQKARVLQFDVSDRDSCKAILEQDVEDNGAYYGVVCNAGITRDNAFPALSGDDWDSVIHTNLDGFYNVLNPLVMPMVRAKKGGRIVTMASVSGLIGNRGQVNYSAAKAGIIGATKALSIELAKRKITVNCVAPGLIETDMIEGVMKDEAMKMIPLRRLGQAEEVASLVGYLLSDQAGYITRQVISINGGMI
ncbi:MAG: 3-oxoacyl-ACP reductase FabG [Methylococcales bacterium]|jgi:3-oxoacyl-[acyl-carrier protein] reductase|nr:3-oxoacyl-ACP reductase FabG [Methylococcales bacterium]MBT7443537.1 3-oxoacyl-ACP reductase FabG [Methylococcales bacterium]